MTKATKGTLATALVCAGAACAYWWTTTPNHALFQIRSAIKTHDLAKFEEYVDTESLCKRLVDDVTAEVADASRDATGAEALGASLGAGLVQLMKPRLVDALQSQLASAIEEGAWRSSEDSSSVAPGELIHLVDGTQSETWQVSDVTVHGKVATVKLTYNGTDYPDALALKFKMRDVGRHWQLVELDNLRETIASIQERDEQRLAEANAPLRGVLDSSLKLVRATNKPRSDDWGISKNVDLTLEFKSTTDRRIESFDATIHVADDAGNVVKKVAIANKSLLAPLALTSGVWTAEIGMFDTSDQALYDLKPGRAKFKAQVTSIQFADGETIKLYDTVSELPQ